MIDETLLEAIGGRHDVRIFTSRNTHERSTIVTVRANVRSPIVETTISDAALEDHAASAGFAVDALVARSTRLIRGEVVVQMFSAGEVDVPPGHTAVIVPVLAKALQNPKDKISEADALIIGQLLLDVVKTYGDQAMCECIALSLMEKVESIRK